MCEATTIALIGATVGASGQLAQSIATQREAVFQAGVASNNQKLIAAQKDDVKRVGARKASRTEIAAQRFVAKQAAALVASGVEIAGGTGAEVIRSTAREAAGDVADVHIETANAVWALDVEQASERAKEKMLKKKAKISGIVAPIGALSTFLTGAAKSGLSFGE